MHLVSRVLFVGLLAWQVVFSIIHWSFDLQFPLAIFFFESWDEFQYLPVLHEYQKALLNSGVLSFLTLRETFGYGDLFWQLYAVLTLPFYFLIEPESSLWLCCLRFVTLALQLLTMFMSWRILGLLGCGDKGRICFSLLLLPMNGLLLLYKPFSPDYLTALLMVVAVWVALRFNKWAIAGFFLCGLAIAVKLYSVFLVPICFLLAWKKVPMRLLAFSPLLLLCGFLCANGELVKTGWDPYATKLANLSSEVNAPNYGHAIQPPGAISYISHWLSNPKGVPYDINTPGISREYLWWTTIAFGLYSIWILWRHRRWEALAISTISWLTFFITITITNRVWSWYLLTPIILIVITMSIAADCLNTPVQRSAVWLILAIHLGTGFYYTSQKSLSFFKHRTSPEVVSKLSFYNDCVKPYRTIAQTLPENEVVYQFFVPVFSILHRSSVCFANGPTHRCFTPQTLMVFLYGPGPEDSKVLAEKFTTVACSSTGSVYLRNDIPAGHPLAESLRKAKSLNPIPSRDR